MSTPKPDPLAPPTPADKVAYAYSQGQQAQRNAALCLEEAASALHALANGLRATSAGVLQRDLSETYDLVHTAVFNAFDLTPVTTALREADEFAARAWRMEGIAANIPIDREA